MKRKLGLVIAAFMFGIFLLPFVTQAGVEGQYLDQKNENTAAIGGSMTINNYNRVQTFTPTVTKITSIDLYLKDKVPGNVLSVVVKKISTGNVVAAAATSVPFGQEGPVGWMTISYDQPFPVVTPCEEYGIYASIVGDTQTKWSWTGGNLYTGGEATGFSNTDFLFRVYGTNDSGVTNTCTATTPTPATPTATTGATLAKPVLVRYEKNGETFNAPFDSEIALKDNDKLNLVGTSFAGAEVTVLVGEKSYDADVVASGDWTVEILASELTAGTHKVTAQAKQGTTSSEVTELPNIKVQTIATTAAPTETNDNAFLTLIADARVLGGLVALMAALVGLLIYLEHKYHGLAKLFTKKEKTEQS